jgi:hypothetical protein
VDGLGMLVNQGVIGINTPASSNAPPSLRAQDDGKLSALINPGFAVA